MATKTYFKLSPSQSGRSMVEIIGVLAIVGVLSIGGIMGYSYAMDKYRANTTVNDIMLRATDLLAQANQGHTELSLTEWENEDTIYPIVNADYATDVSVILDAGTAENPISKRVCEMIFDAIFPHTVQIDTNAVRGVSNAACGDNNVMTFYFDPTGAGPTECEPACRDGEICDNGACFKTNKVAGWWGGNGDTCTTNEDCHRGYSGTSCAYCSSAGKCIRENENAACVLSDGTQGMCTYGKCMAKGCTYDTNICTGKYEYCASPNTDACTAFPEGETGSCVTADPRVYEIDGRLYYVSNPRLSWWDARAFCDALGLDFVPKNELYEMKDGKWQPTEFFKKIKNEYAGEHLNAIWHNEQSKCTGDALGLGEDTCWFKAGPEMGWAGAICR